jgi:ribosomal protein S18 acetylase RimI-like enzyme
MLKSAPPFPKRMRIRPGTLADIAFVSTLSDALTVSCDDPADGFVNYPSVDESEWSRRILNNPHFIIAEDGGRVGFLAGYRNDFLAQLPRNGVFEHMHSKKGPYIYLDQIGVRECARRRGVGRALLEHLLRVEANLPFFGAVVEVPHRNVAIERLLEKLAFSPEEIFYADGLGFRVYRRLSL